MTIEFALLGSGSRGNATLIKTANTLLLVDCGFTLKETQLRAGSLGGSLAEVAAILVTHEHSDHIGGVGPLARKFNLPVYMTRGTALKPSLGRLPELNYITPDQSFMIEDILIDPVTVPHDAREPCQFVFTKQQKSLGLLTDLGCITPHIEERYQSCDALLLECNHDLRMLSAGDYPPSLKRRVGGNWGHLNNQQAANFMATTEHNRLQHIVLSHISEQNNTADLAVAAVQSVYQGKQLQVAEQDAIMDWCELV